MAKTKGMKGQVRTTVFRIALLALGILVLLVAPAATFSRAAAQTGNGDWATPVNLSHSGAASRPVWEAWQVSLRVEFR